MWCVHRPGSGLSRIVSARHEEEARPVTAGSVPAGARRAPVLDVAAPARALDVVHSKLHPPAARPGLVSRTALVNRLRAERSAPLVLLVAPPGYGKTTVIAQWAARDERPLAWLTLDERGNDPVVLLREIAAALERIVPLDAAVHETLADPGRSIWTRAVPRVLRALASAPESFVFVLDEAQWLRAGESADLVALVL